MNTAGSTPAVALAAATRARRSPSSCASENLGLGWSPMAVGMCAIAAAAGAAAALDLLCRFGGIAAYGFWLQVVAFIATDQRSA